jgi:hypothetical protein
MYHPFRVGPLTIMEALAIVSLVGSIIQLVEVGGKLINTTKEIRRSTLGMTSENKTLQDSARRLRELSNKIERSSTGYISDDEQELRRLAAECCDLYNQKLRLIERISFDNTRSFLALYSTLFSNFKQNDEKEELAEVT